MGILLFKEFFGTGCAVLFLMDQLFQAENQREILITVVSIAGSVFFRRKIVENGLPVA